MKKNKFQVKREATYERLIQAGFHVLQTNGYNNTSIKLITDEAGVTKGAFYGHFESKEVFFIELLEYRSKSRQKSLLEMEELFQSNLSVDTLIKEVSTYYFNYLKASPSWNAAYFEFFMASRTNPSLKGYFQNVYDKWILEGEKLVIYLRQKGDIQTERNSKDITKEIYAYIEGLLLHELMYGDTFTEEHLYKGLQTFIRS